MSAGTNTFYLAVKLAILLLVCLVNLLGLTLLNCGRRRYLVAENFNQTFDSILGLVIDTCQDYTSSNDYRPYLDGELDLEVGGCYIANPIVQVGPPVCDDLFPNICKSCLRYTQVVEQSQYLENVYHSNLCESPDSAANIYFRQMQGNRYQIPDGRNGEGNTIYQTSFSTAGAGNEYTGCIQTTTFDYHQVWSDKLVVNRNRRNRDMRWSSRHLDRDTSNTSFNYLKLLNNKVRISEEMFELILGTDSNQYDLISGEMYQERNNLEFLTSAENQAQRVREDEMREVFSGLEDESIDDDILVARNGFGIYQDWLGSNFTYFPEKGMIHK